MTPAPQITTPVDHRDALVYAALHLLQRQLPAEPIAYLWPEADRILFRTSDDHTGDVELLVNWDVAAVTQNTAGEELNCAPVSTESGRQP